MPLQLSEQQEKRLPIRRDNSPIVTREPSAALGAATLEFGRFQVLLRRRELLADGTTVELGTRAFDLLLALLEADGSLVAKEELMRRVWPGIVVAEENLKVQICALRRALGKDRDLIRTEFGRGYRFTATIRSAGAWSSCQRSPRRRHPSGQRAPSEWTSQRSPHGWCRLRSSRAEPQTMPTHRSLTSG
jgi:DNA-binding winged helix-turn-helix (wHTH) protein